MNKWLIKGKKYMARNGNEGTYKGTWDITASGIVFFLEDDEDNTVGTIYKKDIEGGLKK